MGIGIRQAVTADAEGLARLAALTFPLACPAHTTDVAKAAFIAEVLSVDRFGEYLRDSRRQLFVAVDSESGCGSARSESPEDGSRDAKDGGVGESSPVSGSCPEGGSAGTQAGGGDLAGFAMVVFGEPSDPDAAATIRLHPTAEISKLYVLPGHHGTGIAGKLISASLSAARARNAISAWLGVNNENARAARFYRKHGFEIVGTRHFRVGDRLEDDFVMECVL